MRRSNSSFRLSSSLSSSLSLTLALSLSLSLVVLSPVLGAVGPSTLSCSISASCSPDQCDMNTEADCSMTVGPFDLASDLAGMTCKQCTQSSDSKCSDLASKFKPGGAVAGYCNDEYLVIWSDGTAAHDESVSLGQIPLPPGGGTNCRMRSAEKQRQVYKIPLSTSVQSGSNNMPNSIPNVPGMPGGGAVAVATNGVPMFPNYNNRGMPAWVSCELDYCNAHSGRGADYHYHGDPYGPEGQCLYSDSDFVNNHPPMIGWSLDGYLIYGRYTTSSQDNQNTALDSCGGHSHGDYGYHYHSQIETEVSTSELDGTNLNGQTVTYTAYRLAPAECFKGNTDNIPNFFASSNQPNYDRSKGSFDAQGQNDWEQLKPCCSSTKFAVADGYTINGAGTCADSSCKIGTASGSPSGSSPGTTAASNSPVSNPSNSGSQLLSATWLSLLAATVAVLSALSAEGLGFRV